MLTCTPFAHLPYKTPYLPHNTCIHQPFLLLCDCMYHKKWEVVTSAHLGLPVLFCPIHFIFLAMLDSKPVHLTLHEFAPVAPTNLFHPHHANTLSFIWSIFGWYLLLPSRKWWVEDPCLYENIYFAIQMTVDTNILLNWSTGKYVHSMFVFDMICFFDAFSIWCYVLFCCLTSSLFSSSTAK